MAVILQRIVGARARRALLPRLLRAWRARTTSTRRRRWRRGTAIVAVALGMGRAIVEGGACLRFCPRYPQHLLQFSSVDGHAGDDAAGVLGAAARGRARPTAACARRRFGLEVAEADGTLAAVASTYSPENDAVYDGLSRPGRGS